MNKRLFAALACALLVPTAALADGRPRITSGTRIINGGSPDLGKAVVDTFLLMGPTGSGAPYIGDFEDGWNGWIPVDLTQRTVSHWQVSDYNQAVAGNLAAWCGDASIASCNDSLDVVGGYGNNWEDILVYRTAVADPAAGATVNVAATMQIDSEPGYDYVHLSARVAGSLGFVDIQSWDGKATVAVANGVSFLPSELIDGTDVYVAFRFESDGGWSDADCLWQTAGACQIDDITVTVSQTGQADIVSFTDFQDGTFGDWSIDYPAGVGNFAALWRGLADLDPCNENRSRQVAFIDDGIVVPGTGGTDCVNWCYGPGGYIVNTQGGLAGPANHLHVEIHSPVMTWPGDQYDGMLFDFSVYRHEDLSADAPGIFYIWNMRSADTDNSAGNGFQDIGDQGWQSRNFVYYGGPDYLRTSNLVTDLLNPGRDEVQVSLGVYELGWGGWSGNDGYPAPYFDNVAVRVFPAAGPAMATREIDLAQDNFPESDAINLADLGSLHVRFDMADNISLASHLRNDPGDSIVVNIVPARTGAALVGAPRMHYVIAANPVFDPYRTVATAGSVAGVPAVGLSGIPAPDRWAFDLPDTGTLFPGDVLHYYVRASDDLAGDVRVSTIPDDLAGFGDFSDPLAYNSSFTVRALPTITADGFGGYDVPRVLFWNDFANRGGQDEWHSALRTLGMAVGTDYDLYYTNAPSSGVGNGIGGRTNGLALEFYDDLLYSTGDLGFPTLSNGDHDPGDDIAALLNWMSTGSKDLFLTGDHVAGDLAVNAGAAGDLFAQDVLGINFSTQDIRSFIGNQTTPLVVAVPGNPVFMNIPAWIAYGGCFGINRFDGVTPRAGAQRLAEFTDPNGNPGAYAFAAATLNFHNTTNRIVSLPYDLMSIHTDPDAKAAAPLAARARVLSEVLDYFNVVPGGTPSDVPLGERFALANHPNPFNPSTRISYTIASPGHLSLKVYDVRGQLVRTLVDGRVEQSGFVTWDGTDRQGGRVASGVYFSEARMGNDVQVNKMALIK